jgi:molecular chaperone GrpE
VIEVLFRMDSPEKHEQDEQLEPSADSADEAQEVTIDVEGGSAPEPERAAAAGTADEGEPAAATSTPPPPVPPSDAEQALLAAEDKYRRAVADLANAHRRFERERTRLADRAVAQFVEKLLPVIDNMGHSLKAADTSHDPQALIQGFRLIEQQMTQVFAENGIQPIPALGEKFDPEVHHALATEVTDRVEPGTITAELGRGFRMGDQVVRAAQVRVAAAPEPDEPSSTGD